MKIKKQCTGFKIWERDDCGGNTDVFKTVDASDNPKTNDKWWR